MSKTLTLALASAITLASGCATTPPASGEGSCNAEAANRLIGEIASENLAAEAMRLSDAEEFRWIPLDSAVTMDYRPNRLNVELDENNVMRTFRCG